VRFDHLVQIHGFVGDGSPAVCRSVRKRWSYRCGNAHQKLTDGNKS